MQVLQFPEFKRAYKKPHNKQKVVVDHAVETIVTNPQIGQQKVGDLAGIYVYKFDCINQQFLLAYEFEASSLYLLAIGVHENFYRGLKRVKYS